MTGRIANGPASARGGTLADEPADRPGDRRPDGPTDGPTDGTTGAPADGPADGLAERVRRCLEEWSRRAGIAVETWALPAGEVPSRAAHAVLAALREALTLAGRGRAAVSLVSVAVTGGDGGLRMTVSDNGAGLPVDGSGPEVTAMRAAFAAAGGTLSVHAVPGEGTTVTGVLPPRRAGRRRPRGPWRGPGRS
ncbi:nitrate/nitrite sensor protein NarX [Nonomuraea coxensis DSM 45129]|uniref:Nitrate/nitrite sensor protein NarX n=1 Tax=Nonomuraea coxensis DSM 45129 TaxID=1122611 RepID=A0ABX8U0J5_9ACTN|nr:ATP-binding protein [Nonomuraea coxensis]QYC41220.1 nitrate/nitrite sensor protein NarX [Nonomuraea coxensis DSM 45129]